MDDRPTTTGPVPLGPGSPGDGDLERVLAQGHGAGGSVVEVDLPRFQVAIFAIGEARLAFPARDLVEILPLTTVHFVPGCPPALEGVINVRGEVASVLGLGGLLGLEPAPASRRAVILLGQARLDQGEMIRSGLRVDRVIDVLEMTEESIQTAPEGIPESLRGLATGVFLHDGRGVVLLDLAAVFRAFLGGAR